MQQDTEREANIKYLKDLFYSIIESLQVAQGLFEEICTSLDNQENKPIAEPEDLNDRWISPRNFFLQTQICDATHISVLFNRDQEFFNKCGMRKGRKFYIKKEAALQYLKLFSEGRILNNTIKYLKNREDVCSSALPTKPLS